MLSWRNCIQCVVQVTLVAQGDVPLSVVMTVCSTLAAVFLTPLLTKILAGAYIPVDAVKLSLSTLQVVVAPILLGSLIQTAFPSVAQFLSPFAPLMAVLASSLLASSVFSENFVRLRSTIADASPVNGMFFGDVGTVIFSVFLLHFAGFFVGYAAAAIGGFKEKQRRAISIEDTEIDESSKSSSGLTLKLMGVKYLGGSTSWLIINIRL
uniref:Uncharacterized protein n=1 Tax=Zea mays TaxID=4577 RepID=A0A804N6N1_MAIZE